MRFGSRMEALKAYKTMVKNTRSSTKRAEYQAMINQLEYELNFIKGE